MNTLSSFARINSFALLERVPGLSVRHISNSNVRPIESEKKTEGFVSRLKKIFGKSSERVRVDENFGRMFLCLGKSDTVGKNVGVFLNSSKKFANVWYSTQQRLFNFPMRYEVTSHRYLSFLSLLKTVVGLYPRNSEPAPIREPNMPQKPFKDDRKEKKDNKKPVLQTEDNSEEEVIHVQSAMMDEHGNPITEENFVRTQWGVRIKDRVKKVDPQTDVAKTIEKPFYMEKSLWGVNVKQFMTRDEPPWVNTVMPNQNKSSSETTSVEHFNDDVSSLETSSSDSRNSSLQQLERKKEPSKVIKQPETMDQVTQFEVDKVKTEEKDNKTLENFSGEMKNKSDGLHESSKNLSIETDQEFDEELSPDDILSELVPDDEIKAWKNVIEKSKYYQEKERERLLRLNAAKVPTMFLQPEPPEPKRDVRAIPSVRIEPLIENENGTNGLATKSGDEKKTLDGKKSSIRPSKVDDTMNKKLHTSSTSFQSAAAIDDLNQILFTDVNLKTTSIYKDTKSKEPRRQ